VNTPDAVRAAELAARHSYGRLLALLAARTRDIAAAQDALAEALAAALATWPRTGVPREPDAWLMTAARNHLRNAARHQAVVDGSAADLALLLDEAAPEADDLPDRRLALMLVCAHPAIDAAVRTPLMLQVVLGLDAARIAAAFLVPPATMGQRLSRAKAKIRDAGLRFELLDATDLPTRLDEVLDAIYAAFGIGWDDLPGGGPGAGDLAEEAIFLARLLVSLLPAEPEPQGLLALMLYCHAREQARRDERGRFVPLAAQDARLWDRPTLIEAEGWLTAAARARRFGRYQCEAAIQSVHIQRPITGRANHEALLMLYGLLTEHAPSLGAAVGLAATLLDADRPAEALARLQSLEAAQAEGYQPYWVVRARTLQALGESDAAAAALQRALALTRDPAVQAHLQGGG
jgi:RNA polymerase sigma-70 factor (ECF subfamily)